jgi:DNA (cytosine-5)-methyltransferase 1
MAKPIKIIDLFAGPGGLGEGFSSLTDTYRNPLFKIALSVEKEPSAHATLTLRAFYRQFRRGQAPKEYYSFLRGELGKSPDDALFQIPRFRKQVEAARTEARCLTLGEDNVRINAALRQALGGQDDCILIGGPPCQAYSLVGRARRNGIAGYVAEEDGRNFLYQEYLRILKLARPLAFVMENVKGMLSAQVGGERVFDRILTDLSQPWGGRVGPDRRYRIVSLVTDPTSGELVSPSYDPDDFVVRMERYGIPQARHRVILLGLREDVASRWSGDLVLDAQQPVSVQQVIGSLPKLRSGLSKEPDTGTQWLAAVGSIKGDKLQNIRAEAGDEVWRATRSALERITSTPDSRGQMFSPAHVPSNLYAGMPKSLREWFHDPTGEKILCNHETRGHIRSDLHRYLFCASWAEAARGRGGAQFPRPHDYPSLLEPKHENFHSGVFADRFRVQIPDQYATTVTSHISKDGHYFIHYDPAQCRSLTVREAARIQTFPDNYLFLGNRTQQYVQVGNAVPPLIAHRIAHIIALLLCSSSA